MMRVKLPYKDYQFLKKQFDGLERYVVSTQYTLDEDKSVILDIMSSAWPEFRLEYRSMMMRKGKDGEFLNPDGRHMADLYNIYFNNPEEF